MSTEPGAVDGDLASDDPETPSEDPATTADAHEAPTPVPPAGPGATESAPPDVEPDPTPAAGALGQAPTTAPADPPSMTPSPAPAEPPPANVLAPADPETTGSTGTDPETDGSSETDPETTGSTATDPDTDGSSETDPETTGSTATDPETDGSSETDPEDERRRVWPTVVGVGLVIALLAAGVIAGFLLAPDRDGSSGSSTGTKRPLEPPAAGVFDSFARSSGQLGTADSGQSWEEVAGDWTVDGSTVAVTTPSDSGPSLAVVNLQASEGVVQVTMPEPARASGIVFRYENPFNHWAITAAPGSATWVISKVENGEFETVDTLGTAPVDANTTLTVAFDGGRITVYVDGVERTTLFDDFLDGARRAGLVARGPDAMSARWTNFVAFGMDD